ncbi:hypothetical protein WN48_10254 [Eufriesea mexicana]|uniref:Uncharacterized protein n=1 Tax=Eufriesea mexicana TaxID=516756 RepID=A0A310SEF1_9HYME|nr:PREDICTED: uncharacterized protein LOC108552719 [Eufriesea mexicana]OAD53376.1 hypothetical protein WN48_10254 [Eufriesea mexicana]
MMHINRIKIAVLLRSGNSLLKKRFIFPQTYSTFIKRNNEKDKLENDENDKPIKFSTSKAATHPAAYTIARAKQYPKCQPDIISLCIGALLIYFCVLREENDIDEAIVASMSPEVLEQIYGKQEKTKHKN